MGIAWDSLFIEYILTAFRSIYNVSVGSCDTNPSPRSVCQNAEGTTDSGGDSQ